jgi:hypothetical protein
VSTIAASHLTGIAPTGHIVGFDGTVLFHDRDSWRELPRVTRQHLWSITSRGQTAMAAGAGGVLLALDHDRGTLIEPGVTDDLHAVDGELAVGRRGTIVRFVG